MKKTILIFIITLAVSNVITINAKTTSGDITIKCGTWSAVISHNSGCLENITYQGRKVIDRTGLMLGTDKGNISGFKLKSYNFSRKDGCLTLELIADQWTLTDVFTFDSHDVPGLLERSFLLKTTSKASPPPAFTKMISNFVLPRNLNYLIPGTVLGDPRKFSFLKPDPANHKYLDNSQFHFGSTKNLKAGTGINEAAFGKSILVQNSEKTTIAFLNDNRKDRMTSTLFVKSNDSVLSCKYLAQGWALPWKAQHIGSNYAYVCPGKSIAKVLDEVIPKWYKAIGATSPEDRPDWVDNAMVYEINSRFGLKQNGFKHISALIPRVKHLGFNTLYIQPVTAGKQGYLPTDYFKLSPVVGTPEEYRDMLKVAQENDIHILQDIVPHGAYAEQIKQRGNPALWLWYDKKGNCGNKFIMDYKSPGYLKFMYKVANFYMKNFDIDGFRIDQPYGSGINWRRKGFPAYNSSPKNIDVKWFRKSLDAVGGQMPPLPYERASLPYKQGGFDMVANIRNAVKANRPKRGAVLAELITPMFGINADIIYDLFYVLVTSKFMNCEAEQFAPALADYYHERQKCSPTGTWYLREFESHDSLRQFPFWGTGAGRAAYAASVLAEGSPMIFQYADIGHGNFLRQLHRIRNSRKELNKGEARYKVVNSSRPEIWSILRRGGDQFSIGLINFSAKEISTTVEVPISELKLDHSKRYSLVNQMDGKLIARGTTKALSKFKIKLYPFEVVILSSSPKDYQETQKNKINQSVTEEKVKIADGTDYITVTGSNYSVNIDRKNGMIADFSSSSGENVMSEADLLFARKPKAKIKSAKISITDNQITAKRMIGKDTFSITYKFLSDQIKIKTSMSGCPEQEFAALLLPVAFPKNGNWKVNTIDGPLNDSFNMATLESPLISIGDPSLYRDYGHDVSLWDNEYQIIDPSNPVIGCYAENGNGFTVSIDDSLRNAPANMALFQRVGEKQSPALALFYSSPGPLAADAKSSFRFTLRPASYNEKQEAFSKPVNVAGVTFSSESTGYVIENNDYKLRLRRLGGAIRELRNRRTNEVVLEDQKLMCVELKKKKEKNSYNIYDVHAGARVWVENGTLHLRFLGGFQTAGRWNRSETRSWAVTEFAVNGSNTIKTAWYFDCGRAPAHPVKILWQGKIPEALKMKEQNSQVDILNRDKIVTELKDLKRGNISIKGGKLTLAMFNSKACSLPGQFTSDGCTIKINDARGKQPELKNDSFLKYIYADGSFEIWGSAYSLSGDKMIPNQLLSQWPGIWAQNFHGLIGFDRSVPAEGKVSLRLRGANVLGKNTSYYTPMLYYPLAMKKVKKGKYNLQLMVKTEDISNGAKFKVFVVAADEKGNRVMIKREPKVKRNSDWVKIKVPFDVENNLYGPCLRFALENQHRGKLWIDDLKIVKNGK